MDDADKPREPDPLDRQRTVEPPKEVPETAGWEQTPGNGGAKGTLERRYQLRRRIGGGGMGEVWEALDRTLDRPVAVKRLRAELAESAHAVERFFREARTVARLNHPNIVQVYDLGQDAQGPYLVMEFARPWSKPPKAWHFPWRPLPQKGRPRPDPVVP